MVVGEEGRELSVAPGAAGCVVMCGIGTAATTGLASRLAQRGWDKRIPFCGESAARPTRSTALRITWSIVPGSISVSSLKELKTTGTVAGFPPPQFNASHPREAWLSAPQAVTTSRYSRSRRPCSIVDTLQLPLNASVEHCPKRGPGNNSRQHVSRTPDWTWADLALVPPTYGDDLAGTGNLRHLELTGDQRSAV